jgi:5-methyltetrahydropteroyltriglutamate--homocysteine methyltransferase
MKPLFRADQVGSLLRPPNLLTARERFKRGEIDAAHLRSAEDAAIVEAVRKQEAVGLRVIVDGEFRRENWFIDFISRIGGVRIEEGSNPAFLHDATSTVHYVPKNVVTAEKLSRSEPFFANDYKFLAGRTKHTPKITLPSPSRMHFHGGRAVVSPQAYPDIEAFYADIVSIWRNEIAALEAAGARYIQIDDPILAYFVDENMRDGIEREGEKPKARLQRYIRLLNDCIAERGPDTSIGVHICRGNARSSWLAAGGYEFIAQEALGGLDADVLLLEFDDARSGGFEPLRFVPPGRRVVLGLITTKKGQLENPDDLLRRVEEATNYIPLEDLGISTQCGFASVVEGNAIDPLEQWMKLDLVVQTAQSIWGDLG